MIYSRVIYKNSRFTVRRFPFPGDSIPFTVFFHGISGNAHRFSDMPLAFASKETPANFIVILHCDNHLISLRIIELLFRILFKWLTFKSALRIKISKFSASLTLLLYCCFTYVNFLTFPSDYLRKMKRLYVLNYKDTTAT